MTLRKLICDTEHSPVIIFNDTYHCHYHVLRELSWPWHYVSHTFWKSGLTFNTQTKTWLERKTIQIYHISHLHPAYPTAATDADPEYFIEWRIEDKYSKSSSGIEWKNIFIKVPVDSLQSLNPCLMSNYNYDKILRPTPVSWWVILSIRLANDKLRNRKFCRIDC